MKNKMTIGTLTYDLWKLGERLLHVISLLESDMVEEAVKELKEMIND